jgi:uncharacterized protein
MNFNKRQAEELESLLDQNIFPETLNYQECHGFLCALACGPNSLSSEERNIIIFFGDSEQKDTVIPPRACELIDLLFSEINNSFFSAETILLPCSLQIENETLNESLEDWSVGFFEAHMLDEDSWYLKDEEITAEMLLPILLCFEEFDDEAIKKIRNEAELYQNLILQIPQALQDLYLYFHVE